MPSYYYHLKFELYPSPDPTHTASDSVPENIWVPAPGANIFDDLPSHARRTDRIQPEQRPPREQNPAGHTSSVIDCGASRANPTSPDADSEGKGNTVHLTGRQWRRRATSSPPPGFSAGLGPRTASRDWRFGRVSIESFDLVGMAEGDAGAGAGAQPAASLGPNLGGMGQATKGRYVPLPLDTKNTEAGWGIVHLYREADEEGAMRARPEEGEGGGEDGTILCIPAVPSYLSPGDFLGFIGEKWRGDVSHYRMVMTSRLSRYMVLMKFRDDKIAKEWRREFDGKPFDSVESEICHVTFIKSITVEAPNRTANKAEPSSPSVVNSLRPFPPPTPNLIELPTCPVCLERMDDTAGLMTILCQHVFHCACLQTWKGTGCPVCRATNPPLKQSTNNPDDPYSWPFGSGVSNLCSVCDSTEDLWICLICGNVGCGRYKGGHAKDHWKDTAHCYSLELETQHVWDYAGDMWVHRLIRDKGDGKLVDFPSDRNDTQHSTGQNHGSWADQDEEDDVVPRAKLDRIGLEYTHLLTSQLESQRIYFEEMVNKAADKAAKAVSAAESASAQAQEAMRELVALRADYQVLKEETVPALEKELARERIRANKSTDLARSLGKSLQEEKKVGEGLMTRINHLNKEAEGVKKTIEDLRTENEELKEMNRDLSMFISGQEKLKELENEGKLDAAELEGGTTSVPEERKKGKGRRK